jgi:hypothetical protein
MEYFVEKAKDFCLFDDINVIIWEYPYCCVATHEKAAKKPDSLAD